LDGSGIRPSFIRGASRPQAVLVFGSHVYWSNGKPGSGSIARADVKGRGIRPTFISQPSGIQPWALATDGVHLYWSSGDPWIGRANLDGTQVTPHFIYAGAGQSVYGLAVHGATLYLGESGQIVQVAAT